jgi:hypothetical protein
VFPTFIYGIETWEGDFQNSHWKVFKKGGEDAYDVLHQLCSSTTYFLWLAEFEKLPIELHTIELTIGFQQQLAP